MSPTSPPVVFAIDACLKRGVRDGVFPGACAAVYVKGALAHLSAAGHAQCIPEPRDATPETRFDLASLTKVLATTPAVLALAARGLLDLDEPVARHWPAFAASGKAEVTVRHLLAHSSGLAAWRPLFLAAKADPATSPLFSPQRPEDDLTRLGQRGKALLLAAVEREPLEAPPGSRALYCDLGFIALGRLVEIVSGEPLEVFAERAVFSPLGLTTLHFRPLGATPIREGEVFAATGLWRPREPAPGQESLVPPPDRSQPPQVRPGEVDDDNAYAMGGVAGHAGLFGTARDVAAFGAAVLAELRGAGRLAPPSLWEKACERQGPAGSTRALGFDTPSASGSSAGGHIARSAAVGHLGFTGTSLWIDRRRELAVALLTNRVHPTRANERIREFRPAFHDLVVEALGLV